MGFEDRDYNQSGYQDSYQGGYRDSYSNAGGYRSAFNERSMVVTLIIINVVVFVLDMFTPKINQPANIPANITPEQVAAELEIPVEEAEKRIENARNPDATQWLSKFLSLDADGLWKVWGFLTYGFAHASLQTETGVFHILFNMLTLFFLGVPVERRLGRSEFLRFYLVSIVVSGLIWLIWKFTVGDGNGFIVGASGAVAAVTLYFVFMDPHAKVALWGVLEVPSWLIGVLFFIWNVSHALTPGTHIAWQAHFGGAAFGILYYKLGWNLGRFDLGLDKIFSNRPKLKIHDPSVKEENLKAQADEILAKINEQGEESLTRKERKILNKWSEKIRKSRKAD